MAQIDPNKITLTVCKKCRDVMYYFEEDLHEIPEKCEECGGTIVISDKYETEWYDEYIKTHPGTTRKNLDIDVVYKWVAEIVTSDSDEFDPEEQKRVEEEWGEFMSQPSKPHCPKCLSTDLRREKKGFSAGRAIAVTALTGFIDVGAVSGLIGKDKLVNVCNACGHRWK